MPHTFICAQTVRKHFQFLRGCPIFILKYIGSQDSWVGRDIAAHPPQPLSKPVQVLLNGIPSFWHINSTIQLGVISVFAEDALNPTAYVINKDVEEHKFQDRPLKDTTHGQPPTGRRLVDHNPLAAAIQPIP